MTLFGRRTASDSDWLLGAYMCVLIRSSIQSITSKSGLSRLALESVIDIRRLDVGNGPIGCLQHSHQRFTSRILLGVRE